MNYCEKCMRPLEGSVCSVCGKLPQVPEYHLAPGTVMQEKYLVGRAMSEDSGSITYIGRDISADQVIAIREYFPAETAWRDHRQGNAISGMEKHDGAVNRFAEKARLLSEFRNEPCVAGVYDFFRQNHTAYMIMEGPGGLSMQTFVWKKGPVPIDSLLELMKPMLKTLCQIHRKGLIHRNICPENIRMYGDGSMKLVNFGTVQGAVDENSLKPGYAPAELYGLHGRSGPWSDVYALCASIYTCITGQIPPLSAERAAADTIYRPSEFGVTLSSRQEAALMRGLAVWPEERYQSVEQLMDALDLVDPEPVAEMTSETMVFEPVLTEPLPREEVLNVPAAETAPRWEPVEDPATWDLPFITNGAAPVDPVLRQGRSYEEPAFTVATPEPAKIWEEIEQPEAADAEHVWEHHGAMDDALLPEAPVQTSMWEEPAVRSEEAETSAPVEEIRQPQPVVYEEPVQPEELEQTTMWEAPAAQPEPDDMTMPMQPAWQAPADVEQTLSAPVKEPEWEAAQEVAPQDDVAVDDALWQGDYHPVEPIDPKFWEKELGLEKPDAPMPWEEAPGAWEQTPKPWDVPEPWQPMPEEEAPKKKMKWIWISAAAVAAVALIFAAVYFIFLRGDKAQDISMSLNGVDYELPCTLAEMMENGWSAENAETSSEISGGKVLYFNLEQDGEIRVLAENEGQDAIPMEACVVTRISVTDPDVDLEVEGLDLSATLDEVQSKLGKPTSSEEGSLTYRDSNGCLWIFAAAEDGQGLKSISVEVDK